MYVVRMPQMSVGLAPFNLSQPDWPQPGFKAVCTNDGLVSFPDVLHSRLSNTDRRAWRTRGAKHRSLLGFSLVSSSLALYMNGCVWTWIQTVWGRRYQRRAFNITFGALTSMGTTAPAVLLGQTILSGWALNISLPYKFETPLDFR